METQQTPIMILQNLQQENDTLLMTKIMDNMDEDIKMIQPLNLRQSLLDQIFVTAIKSFQINSDAYFLVTGDIKVENFAANTNVAFKNCAPFTRCVTHINDDHFETVGNLDRIMSMYNLIEYGDNYSDSSGSLYQFKRDESPFFKCCF